MLGNDDPNVPNLTMRTHNPPSPQPTFIALAALVLSAAIPCALAQTAASDDESRAVLNRFLGRWQTHTQIHLS
jgi:hypothetical protein